MTTRKKLIEVALPLEAINKASMPRLPAFHDPFIGGGTGAQPSLVPARTRAEPSQLDGEPLPAWFGALGKYTRNAKRHDMEAIRESIAAGLAKEHGL